MGMICSGPGFKGPRPLKRVSPNCFTNPKPKNGRVFEQPWKRVVFLKAFKCFNPHVLFQELSGKQPNFIKGQRLDPLQWFKGRIQARGAGGTSISLPTGKKPRNPACITFTAGASLLANLVEHISSSILLIKSP